MTTPTTAELLKYADLQMAAEAFLVDAQSQPLTGDLYIQALKRGNEHSSKFTEPQATEFAKHWIVLDQRANTPTGFSGIERTTSLKTLIDRFTVLSANSDGQAFSFTDSGLSPDLEAKMVLNAIGRIDTIRSEVSRLGGITNNQGTPVKQVHDSSIGQESLDYQMAVLTLKPSTNAASLLNGTRQMIGDKEYVNPANRVSSQFDVVGDTSPSAVSNSQWHIGTDVRVFIEDQPLYRGSVLVASYAGSFIVAHAFTTESIAACACNSRARRRFDPKNRVRKTMAFAVRSAA